MAVPAVGDLPLFGPLRDLVDGVLENSPPWLRSVAWAVVAFGALFGIAWVVVRAGFPLAARFLPRPVARGIDVAGVVLVLPEFLVTTLLRRVGRPLPRSLISYGDSVHEAVVGAVAVAGRGLARLGRLRSVSVATILVVLACLTVGWNWTYCVGRDDTCQTPTTEWTDLVSQER